MFCLGFVPIWRQNSRDRAKMSNVENNSHVIQDIQIYVCCPDLWDTAFFYVKYFSLYPDNFSIMRGETAFKGNFTFLK